MKVLFVLDDYPPYIKGGTAVSTSLLVNWLSKHGNTISVACSKFTDKPWVENGVVVYPVIAKPSFESKNLPSAIWQAFYIIALQINSMVQVLRLINKLKPEIVTIVPTSYRFIPIIIGVRIFGQRPTVVNCVDCSLVCPAQLSATHLDGIKDFDETVQTHHGYRCIGYKSTNDSSFLSIRPFALYESTVFNVYKFSIRFLVNHLNGIKLVGVSKFIQDQLILNGFDAKRTTNIPDISESITGRHYVENLKIPTFVFGGRVETDKGIWDIVAAAEILKKQLKKPFEVKIAGTGSEFNNLKKYIQENKLTYITLLGHIKPAEILDLYEKSIAIIGPSRSPEAFGRFILEAISVGKPIIATRSGGIPDNVDDGITGLLIDVGNIKQLANAMKYFIEDPERSEMMRPAIIKKQKKYEANFIGKENMELYQNLCLRRP